MEKCLSSHLAGICLNPHVICNPNEMNIINHFVTQLQKRRTNKQICQNDCVVYLAKIFVPMTKPAEIYMRHSQ